MNNKQKEAIRVNRRDLVEALSQQAVIVELLSYLEVNGVITADHREICTKNELLNKDQIMRLLDILKWKGQGWQALTDFITQQGFDELLNNLNKSAGIQAEPTVLPTITTNSSNVADGDTLSSSTMERQVTEAEIEKLVELLEVESAQLYDLPDSEFTDAYLSFRSTAKRVIDEYLSVGIIGYIMKHTGLLRFTKWFLNEGIELRKRDPDTFTLDPAPFDYMIDTLITCTRPQDQNSFFTEQELANWKYLKTFADNLIEQISTYGLSAAAVQKNFFATVSTIIDGFGYSSKSVPISKELNPTHSVEVLKTGVVVIAWHRSKFDGTITSRCCCDKQTIRMSVDVKVWKFHTLADLKQEYKKVLMK